MRSTQKAKPQNKVICSTNKQLLDNKKKLNHHLLKHEPDYDDFINKDLLEIYGKTKLPNTIDLCKKVTEKLECFLSTNNIDKDSDEEKNLKVILQAMYEAINPSELSANVGLVTSLTLGYFSIVDSKGMNVLGFISLIFFIYSLSQIYRAFGKPANKKRVIKICLDILNYR